jgi:hypothetical protein
MILLLLCFDFLYTPLHDTVRGIWHGEKELWYILLICLLSCSFHSHGSVLSRCGMLNCHRCTMLIGWLGLCMHTFWLLVWVIQIKFRLLTVVFNLTSFLFGRHLWWARIVEREMRIGELAWNCSMFDGFNLSMCA